MKRLTKLFGVIAIAAALLMPVSCEKGIDATQPVVNPPTGIIKATIVVNGTSIQEAINVSVAGDLVEVLPGTYNEQIILKDGVDLYLHEGVIIDNNNAVANSTITDNNVAVNCTIQGQGVIKRSGTNNYSAHVILISNANSNIALYYKKIESVLSYGSTVEIQGGTVYLEGGLITGKGMGLNVRYLNNPVVTWAGDSIYSLTDYGILNSYKCYASGFVKSDGYSAVVSSGNINAHLEFSGYALATHYNAFEQIGGSAYIHDAVIENTVTDDVWSAVPLSKPSGDTLKLSNVTLIAHHPDVYSIETQGGEIPYNSMIYVLNNSYANRPFQTEPPMLWMEGIDKMYSIPPANLAATKNFKGKYKIVTLTWESTNNNFEVWKDGVLDGTTTTTTYNDTVPGGFKQATYTVYSVIPTLQKGSASITVVK